MHDNSVTFVDEPLLVGSRICGASISRNEERSRYESRVYYPHPMVDPGGLSSGLTETLRLKKEKLSADLGVEEDEEMANAVDTEDDFVAVSMSVKFIISLQPGCS